MDKEETGTWGSQPAGDDYTREAGGRQEKGEQPIPKKFPATIP
jgi:hypothetical protein